MPRLLLRLLLIVSLVMNAVGAPWAVAGTPVGSGAHDHAAMMANTGSEPADAMDCHHAASSAAEVRSCCDGPSCRCGCVLPPALTRVVLILPLPTWDIAPFAVPAMRGVVRRAVPPFRPPAA